MCTSEAQFVTLYNYWQLAIVSRWSSVDQ